MRVETIAHATNIALMLHDGPFSHITYFAPRPVDLLRST